MAFHRKEHEFSIQHMILKAKYFHIQRKQKRKLPPKSTLSNLHWFWTKRHWIFQKASSQKINTKQVSWGSSQKYTKWHSLWIIAPSVFSFHECEQNKQQQSLHNSYVYLKQANRFYFKWFWSKQWWYECELIFSTSRLPQITLFCTREPPPSYFLYNIGIR